MFRIQHINNTEVPSRPCMPYSYPRTFGARTVFTGVLQNVLNFCLANVVTIYVWFSCLSIDVISYFHNFCSILRMLLPRFNRRLSLLFRRLRLLVLTTLTADIAMVWLLTCDSTNHRYPSFAGLKVSYPRGLINKKYKFWWDGTEHSP